MTLTARFLSFVVCNKFRLYDYLDKNAVILVSLLKVKRRFVIPTLQ